MVLWDPLCTLSATEQLRPYPFIKVSFIRPFIHFFFSGNIHYETADARLYSRCWGYSGDTWSSSLPSQCLTSSEEATNSVASVDRSYGILRTIPSLSFKIIRFEHSHKILRFSILNNLSKGEVNKVHFIDLAKLPPVNFDFRSIPQMLNKCL